MFGVQARGDHHLHIGLAGTEPDLPHIDIPHHLFLIAATNPQLEGTARMEGRKHDPPLPALIGDRLDRCSPEHDLNRSTRLGPSPDRNRFVPLKHSMIAEQTRQFHGTHF